MTELLNISQIKKKMKSKPLGQRLYLFFYGTPNVLTKKQIEEVKKIIEDEHEKTISFLNNAALTAPKKIS